MTEQLRAYLDEQAQELDDSVRQVLEICSGDTLSALRAVLVANAFLQEENEQLRSQVSSGFTRGGVRKPAARSNG